MMKTDDQLDPSKLAYSITISLELYPGERATKEELSELKCNSRWEAVRQAWSEFTGKPYVITPQYQSIKQNRPNNPQYNRTQRYYPYQNTRRARGYYGGNKKNKTKQNKMKLNKTIKLK